MPTSMQAGDVLAGRYRLDDLLAESDGGRFWRAHDQVLHRAVAVHLLPGDDERAPALLEAARRSGPVVNRRLLRVLDAEVADGRCYVVNEWGQGDSLDNLLTREGPLAPRRAAWLVGEVADSMAEAHDAGLAHGCLTPENVLVDQHGQVRIIGFGVEAALRGLPAGRISVDEIDLAGLLYCALTGKWAGVSESGVPAAPEVHGDVLRPRRVRAGIPRMLDALCDQVLNPEHAPGEAGSDYTARRIRDLLHDYVGDVAGTPLPVAPGRPLVATPAPSPTVPDGEVVDPDAIEPEPEPEPHAGARPEPEPSRPRAGTGARPRACRDTCHRPPHPGRDAGLPRRRRGRLAACARRQARSPAAARRPDPEAALRPRPARRGARTPSAPRQPRGDRRPGLLALGRLPGLLGQPGLRCPAARARHGLVVVGVVDRRPLGHRRRPRRHRRAGAGAQLDPARDDRRASACWWASRRSRPTSSGSSRPLPVAPRTSRPRARARPWPSRPPSPTSSPTTSTRRALRRARRTPTRSPTSSTATRPPRGPPRPTSRTSGLPGSRAASAWWSTSAPPARCARWW